MRKIAALFAILIGTSFAADRPDLAGTWVCNMERSNFGKTPKLQGLTLQVEHKGGDVLHAIQTMNDGQGTKTYEVDWFMDGKIHPMDATAAPNKMTTMSKWEGNSIAADRKSDDGTFEEKIRITFSADGKTATEHVSVKSPNANNTTTLIWEKK